MKLFSHLDSEGKQNYEYKRLITVFNRKDGGTSVIENEPYLIDQVELNARLYNMQLEYEIDDLSQQYILLSFAQLYCFICPILSTMVFLNNVLTMRWNRTTHLKYLQKKSLLQQNGLGAWMDVLEYLGYATVILNCIFLYWFRMDFITTGYEQVYAFRWFFPDSLNKFIMKEIELLGPFKYSDYTGVTDKDMLNFCILIIITEHAIVFFKYLIMAMVGDTPVWVQKQLIKINNQMDKMSIKQKEDEA